MLQPIEKIVPTPFDKFFRIESLGGIMLVVATVIALIWANSPFGDVYTQIWQYEIGFRTEGAFDLYKPLVLWVNDGLMVVFFFLIGMEIKMELLIGELNERRKAILPVFAALGGIIVPVGLFFLLNQDPDAVRGWGVPMATDIAFSLAILKLVGKRIPFGLKTFLTAFAIVDDIAAVLVIALFYSGQIDWILIGISAVLLVGLYYLSHRGVYARYLVFVVGVAVWMMFLKSGIHPTIAGILLAFAVPLRQRMSSREYGDQLMDIARGIKKEADSTHPILTKKQMYLLGDLEDWTSRVQSPLQLLKQRLHGWVAYIIVPLFAFANAGVIIRTDQIDLTLAIIIAVCLVVGKSVGIPLMTWLSVRSGVARMPQGVAFGQVIGTGLLAGIGFTMSIFIANLAFRDPMLTNSAKFGILAGSCIAAVIGYGILRRWPGGNDENGDSG